MPLRRAVIPALAALALAVGAPAADAAFFPPEPIDGPGDLLALGGADMARDGTGGVVYLKRDGGVAHVFLSRFTGGAWRPPERVDAGVVDAASDAAIAVADGNRLAVLWTAGTRLYGSVFAGGAAPGPLAGPSPLFAGSSALTGLDVDMGINGTAYGVWRTGGGGGADVAAVRLQGSTWELVPAPLDIAPAQAAGDGAGRPRVAVSAEGNAVATWGEKGPDGRSHVFGRRLTGLGLSQYPQEISLPDGGTADSPDIAIEYDGSFAWVAFRQDLGGASRAVARRLVGSSYEAPAIVDVGPGSVAPRIALTGRGVGLAASAGPGGAAATSLLVEDVFGQPLVLGGGAAPADPVVGISERDDMVLAWRRADGVVAGRFKPGQKAFEAETALSTPQLGAVGVDAYDVAGSRLGDFVVPALQGPPAARRLAAAVYDRPPGKPAATTASSFQRRSKPRLRWTAGTDLLGASVFKVLIDGAEVGTTDSQHEFVSPQPVSEGAHRWQVIAVDRHGQQTPSRTRRLRIDSARPKVRLSVRGTRRRGRPLRIVVSASDRKGSGVAGVRVDYGDGSRTKRERSTHRYRSGRFTLKVTVSDRAGNVGRRSLKLRIGG